MNQNNEVTLGSKLRYFRKRAKMSQMQLENEIGAAAGSLSRIENNEVNPTKETLQNISKFLNLKPTEIGYLLGNHYSKTSAEDKNSAVASVNEMMSIPTVFAYLIDEQSKIIKVSKGFSELGKSVGYDTNNLIGMRTVEILFDSERGLRNYISETAFKDTAKGVLGVIKFERDFLLEENWMQEQITNLKKIQEFNELWDNLNEDETDLLAPVHRYVELNLNGRKLKMQFFFTPLDIDHRFQLVEYFPTE